MFDDQQPLTNIGQVPKNLPTEEPEDMFDGVAEEKNNVVLEKNSSALDAGILRPKTENIMPDKIGNNFSSRISPNPTTITVPPDDLRGVSDDVDYQIKEPLGKKNIVTWLVIFIFVAILGGGSAWVYFSFIKEKTDFNVIPDTVDVEIDDTEENNVVQNDNLEINNNQETNDLSSSTDNLDDNILFGSELIDTDDDGLDDVRERDLGTEPLNWDSDEDSLNDFEEVVTFKTNPLKADTDGDGFNDNVEIKNGYNPNGEGKFYQLPEDGEVTTTPSSSPS